MKLLIKKIIFFVIPILILAYPLDFIMSCFLKKSMKAPFEKQVWNYIYENKEVPEIAIYGSSKAWVQISPKILEDSLKKSVYNYGFDGQTFWLEYLRHLEIEKNNKTSKYIILLLDVGSFWSNNRLYNHMEFLPYMLHNQNMKTYLLPFKYYKASDFDIPLKRYASNGMELVYWFWKDSNTRVKGYAPNDVSWQYHLENAKKINKKITIPIYKKDLALFEQFIIETKKNNKQLILVSTPDYIEGQVYMENCRENIALYEKIAKKYGIPYLNYYQDSLMYNQSLYYNATHLNKNGAEYLSKKIAHDLKKNFESQY